MCLVSAEHAPNVDEKLWLTHHIGIQYFTVEFKVGVSSCLCIADGNPLSPRYTITMLHRKETVRTYRLQE